MRGLTTHELECIKMSAPDMPDTEDISDSDAEICELLATRGLMNHWVTWTEEEGRIDYYETSSIGMMMLQIYMGNLNV